MRVVAISCVKNEVDIVEAFVRHTAAVTDHLIVLDNGSTDGTRDILSALQQRGLPLDVVDDPSIGHLQWKRMTRLMHTAGLDCGADWVLPLDADEFFVAGPGGGIFGQGADEVSGALQHLFWRSYVPLASDDPSEINSVRRIRHRLAEEGYPWAKVVIPGALARLPAARVAQGSHALEVNGALCPSRQCERASLAHFPVRSPGQYAAKVTIHRLQYFATPNPSSSSKRIPSASRRASERRPPAMPSSKMGWLSPGSLKIPSSTWEVQSSTHRPATTEHGS